MKSKLAIFGGPKVRKNPFPKHPVIEDVEKKAVIEVLNKGNLSTFIASPGEYFLGGEKIKEFEEAFKKYINSKYAISLNSATAGLHAAIAAAYIGPGDEVIVPPYTFTSTATCALMNSAIPVFVDIDPDTFCIDPEKINEAITPRTKAIIPVHLFGLPTDMNPIMEIAENNDLVVIEDVAQAPGAKYKGNLAGTIGDFGVFSFTESKTITTGEGGMVITDDEEFAERVRMVRNHGEVITDSSHRDYISNLIGWNYRMTEISAALGIVQLKKLDMLNKMRIGLANYLIKKISKFEGFTPQLTKPSLTNVYYVVAFKYDEDKIGISRDLFVKALNAEGIPFSLGYVPPLYWSPIYQEKKGFGRTNWPFEWMSYKSNINYDKGICPVTERLYEKELMLIGVCRYPATKQDMDDIVKGIEKVLENVDILKKHNK
jgi:dTDP-4-amino-4,6-dideoxygalactose transaminase